jgi:hypothetical protein
MSCFATDVLVSHGTVESECVNSIGNTIIVTCANQKEEQVQHQTRYNFS